MFTLLQKLLIPTLLVFGVATASANELSDQQIDRLLSLSGLSQQVKELPQLIKSGAQQGMLENGDASDPKFAAVLSSLDQMFSPSDILAKVRDALRPVLTQEDFNRLSIWYESGPGQRITLAEEQGSTPEAMQDMVAQAEALLADQEAINYAFQLDELVGATDMVMQVQDSVASATFTSLMQATKGVTEEDLALLQQQLDTTRDQRRAAVQQMTVLAAVYNYRDIDAASKQKYLDFLSEPAAQRFNSTISASFGQALADSMHSWLELLISQQGQ